MTSFARTTSLASFARNDSTSAWLSSSCCRSAAFSASTMRNCLKVSRWYVVRRPIITENVRCCGGVDQSRTRGRQLGREPVETGPEETSEHRTRVVPRDRRTAVQRINGTRSPAKQLPPRIKYPSPRTKRHKAHLACGVGTNQRVSCSQNNNS